MISIRTFVLTAAAAIAMSACTQPAANAPANANHANTNVSTNANANAAAPMAAAPSKETLLAIEKQGWEAWKNRDPKFSEEYLSDKYVGFASAGRMDKAGSIKSLTDTKCDVKSYSWSDEQMDMLGADVAVLTFKAAQDYTCDGKKGAPTTWSTSVYAREGDKWKNVYYSETPVVDPNAPAAKTAAPATAAKPAAPADASTDTLATTLMAIENKGWEAWKNRDVKGVEEIMGQKFMYLGDKGRQDRAAAIKGWSEPKCVGLGYTLSDPKAVTISKDVALVTYKADVKGTCDGKPTPPSLWVASFDVKEGDAWKNGFYTDLPR